MSSLPVADVDLPTADKMKVLGVVLDRRLLQQQTMANIFLYTHLASVVTDNGQITGIQLHDLFTWYSPLYLYRLAN